MARRNISTESAKKTFQTQTIFVLMLTLCAFIRIATEKDTDGNTVIFGTILSIAVIIAISIFNKFAIEVCNVLNDKWMVINYFVPGILIGLIVLALRIPIDIIDVLLLVAVMSIANLTVYGLRRRSRE